MTTRRWEEATLKVQHFPSKAAVLWEGDKHVQKGVENVNAASFR
jgi:hypothetical protein